jgi:hypothetical protein
MKFLSDVLAKAGLTVDGVVTLNNTATGQTPNANDNSTKLATTAWVRTFVQPYSLPIASASVLGGIKVGNGLSIDAITGVLTASGGGISTFRDKEIFTTTAGQTTFTLQNTYTPGLLDVFVNGVYLNDDSYTASNGSTVVLDDATALNDIVTFFIYSPYYVGETPSARSTCAFTATSGQTTFLCSYVVGSVDVFYNGSKLASSEFTATNGTSIVLTSACVAGDYIEIVSWLAGGGVFSSRTITIDGVTQDLTANRTWNILPTGGAAGDILAKTSATNYAVAWIPNFTSTVQHTVKAAVALTAGQAVYVSSADGTNMIVSKASNASEQTSSKTLGLVAQNLAINGQGFVVTEGLLAGLNTSTANAGDPVWLGTDGNLIFGLLNKPVAPAHLVFIGVVTRVQQNNGEIFVKVQNGFELDELHDLSVKNASDGDMIKYVASTGLWTKIAATTTNITEGTNLYYTNTRVASYLTANSYNSGTGTTNYLPKFTGSTTIGNSQVFDDGTNIGINQAIPTRTLDILGASGIGTVLKLQGASGTTTYLQLAYNGATNAQSGYIGYNSSSQMQFFTNDTLALTLASNQAATFSSSVTAASITTQFITVNSASGQIGSFRSTNVNGGYITWESSTGTIADIGTTQQIFGAGGNDTFGINGRGARALTFGTNNTEGMRMFSSRNVHIGPTPGSDNGARLQVSGEGRFYQPLTSTTSYLTVENNRARNAAVKLKTTVGDFLVGVGIGTDTNQFQIYDNTAGANRLTINSTGAATFSSSVTVDTDVTLNSGTLFVSAGSGQAYSGRLSTAYIFPWITTYLDSYAGAGWEGRLQFRTNSGNGAMNTQMTILNSGNVGIGASSLLERLGVNGNIHVEGVGNSIYFDTDGNGRTIQQYVTNQFQFHIVNARGNSARFVLGNSSISLGTSSTPQFFINTTNGNIGINTISDNGRKLNVNGSGLFSGTLSTAKVEVGAVESVNITTNSTFTLVSSSNFNIRTNILVSVTIRWNSNANAQRQYLLFIGATDTGWGTPNSAIFVIASNDWSSGYVGAATFSIGGSGSLRTLNISVANAATYNVTANASIIDM